MASTRTAGRWLEWACVIVVAAIAPGALTACGGGGSKANSRVEKIAKCVDATNARAAPSGSSLKTALGAIDVAKPYGVAQVFKSPEAARAYAQEKETYLHKTQIKDVVVQTTDANDTELVTLFRGCV